MKLGGARIASARGESRSGADRLPFGARTIAFLWGSPEVTWCEGRAYEAGQSERGDVRRPLGRVFLTYFLVIETKKK